MFGMSQKEKSLKEDARISAELGKWPVVTIDRAKDAICIDLTNRLRGAIECQSPFVSEIRAEYAAAIKNRDYDKQAAGAKCYRLAQEREANNRPFISDFHRKCTLRVEQVSKLYKRREEGKTKNYLNDQVTRKYSTNEETVDAIRDRILADRAEVSAMFNRPLPEILAKIDAHHNWFQTVDLDEIPVDQKVEVPGALPKWART
jgi:hypothetical protein